MFLDTNMKWDPANTVPHWAKWDEGSVTEMLFNKTDSGRPVFDSIATSRELLERCEWVLDLLELINMLTKWLASGRELVLPLHSRLLKHNVMVVWLWVMVELVKPGDQRPQIWKQYNCIVAKEGVTLNSAAGLKMCYVWNILWFYYPWLLLK